MKPLVFFLALLCPTTMLLADATQPSYEAKTFLLLEYERSSKTSDGSSTGSSNGRQALIETVVKETPRGTLLEYDWPRDEQGDAKSGFWYFPARILERPDGSLELLEIEVIEERIDQWLKKRKFPRKACGLWTHGGGFPFKFDCDPHSILDEIAPFDLRIPNLAVGREYLHPLSAAPGILKSLPAPRFGYFATVAIDETKAREEEAERALVLAQMLGRPLSPQEAQENAAKIGYSGSITIEFDVGGAGVVTKKTVRSEVQIMRPNEEKETKTSKTTVTRLELEDAAKKFSKSNTLDVD